MSVNFSILINNYDEDEPTPQIDIQIDRTILRDLEVSVFGGTVQKDCYSRYCEP